jgi:aminomethyltransferase
MGTAWEYSSDPNDEHDAIRESAGMFDMSPLKKIRVRGPDAAAVVDHLHSRDATRLAPGQSAYGAVLTEQGTVGDDAIAFNNGDDGWLVVHGSGATMEMLADSAARRDVSFELDDDLHIISVQGPASLKLLEANAAGDVGALNYFNHAKTQLFGHEVLLSRTGYSGERGYEIFASASSIGQLWDEIVALDVMPASFGALDKVRIEAALLFYGYDMTDQHFPSEVGLGWAISKNGGDYRGKAAALAAQGSERFVQTGISVEHGEAMAGGETVRANGIDVGTVNSPAFSQRLNKSLALAHISPYAATVGTSLELIGDGVTYQAMVEAIPFFDPQKSRTHG